MPPNERSDPQKPAEATDPPTVALLSEGRLARLLFYGVLFGVSFGLAVLVVWLVGAPAQEADASVLRTFIGAQPIPSGIVFFTIFAMVLWRFRYDLPLADRIGVGGRRDVPVAARERFEDATVLLEEAQRILRAKKRDIDRELSVSERDDVRRALDSLERTMTAQRFDLDRFDAEHLKADKLVTEHLGRWRKGELREYAESIGIAVAVALVLRGFVVEAFKIPSGSMIPTLMVGDHIFVNKLSYGPLVPWTDSRLWSSLPPRRGDVMVFKFPENKDQDFIKRTIAVPGDTLEAIDGRPILNGWLVPHCYVGPYKVDDSTADLYVEYLEDRTYFTLFEHKPDDRPCATSEDCGAGATCKAGVCGQTYQGPFYAKEKEVWVMGDNRNNSHDSRTWRGGMGGGVPFENIKGRAMFVWMSFGPGGGIAQERLFVNVMGRPQLPGLKDPMLKSNLEKCITNRPPVSETTPPPGSSAPPPPKKGRR